MFAHGCLLTLVCLLPSCLGFSSLPSCEPSKRFVGNSIANSLPYQLFLPLLLVHNKRTTSLSYSVCPLFHSLHHIRMFPILFHSHFPISMQASLSSLPISPSLFIFAMLSFLPITIHRTNPTRPRHPQPLAPNPHKHTSPSQQAFNDASQSP